MSDRILTFCCQSRLQHFGARPHFPGDGTTHMRIVPSVARHDDTPDPHRRRPHDCLPVARRLRRG
ncbi:hypothetical protein BCEN4_370127 [Burkholderia cenocepacia]|nr:hypothetical protein BCEN4_370127 [Burkholderia cenocepacia]